MKKITLFTNSLESGGQERQLSILANLLSNNGYKISLVTINDSQDHYELNSKIIREKLCRTTSKRQWKFVKIFMYFLRLRTDCIICYGQRESFFLLIPMLFRKTPKIICSERNYTIGKSSLIEKCLVNFLYSRANYIVPNSYSQSEHLINANKKLEKKVCTIINYTDIDKFIPMPQPHNHQTQIGIFCRYERQKNCLAFVKMIALLKEKCQNDFIIKWYGSKQFSNSFLENYYKEIESLVKQKGLDEIVKLNDATKDVAAAMSEMDVIALPSLHEGFSNSISEAICCGKPMLVSDVSDNKVMVKEGANGFLFNPMDLNEMCEKFLFFLNLPQEKRIEMGKESRKIAESLFNKKRFLDSYINLIEE